MREIFKMIKKKEKDYSYIQMEINTREIGRMESNTIREYGNSKTDHKDKQLLIKVKKLKSLYNNKNLKNKKNNKFDNFKRKGS